MKKTISENDLKNIIKEATEIVLNENWYTNYGLNNITWNRKDGSDDDSAEITDAAAQVRSYLVNKYPSLKGRNGFGSNMKGFDTDNVFAAMKTDVQTGSNTYGDNNGAKEEETRQNANIKEALGRFALSQEEQEDGKYNELAKDFSMLLDVCSLRSGLFRNYGSDHELTKYAKEKICKSYNLTYTPSKYAGSNYNNGNMQGNEGGKSNEPQQPGKNQTNPKPATKKPQPDQRIKRLQQMLNNGLWAYPKLAEDGLLGPKTKAVAASAGVNPATWNYTPIPQNPAFVGDAAGRFATAPQAQQTAPVAQQAVNTTQAAQSAPVAQQAIATAPVNAADRLQSIKAPMAESNARLKQIIREEVLNALKGMK